MVAKETEARVECSFCAQEIESPDERTIKTSMHYTCWPLFMFFQDFRSGEGGASLTTTCVGGCEAALENGADIANFADIYGGNYTFCLECYERLKGMDGELIGDVIVAAVMRLKEREAL